MFNFLKEFFTIRKEDRFEKDLKEHPNDRILRFYKKHPSVKYFFQQTIAGRVVGFIIIVVPIFAILSLFGFQYYLFYGFPVYLWRLMNAEKKVVLSPKDKAQSTIYSHAVSPKTLRKKNVLKPAAIDIAEAISVDEFYQWLRKEGFIAPLGKE